MKFFFISIGKTRDKNLESLILEYHSRIKRYFPAEILELKEPKNVSSKDTGKIIELEGKLLKEHIKGGAYTFVLSEEGKNYSTRDFASHLSKKINSGIKSINFIIGGPFGISDEVKKSSNEVISLSKLTFTHEMARVIILEQVYRALTLLRGEKYHY